MDWHIGVDTIADALSEIPWKVWEVSPDNMDAPAFKDMDSVPKRYSPGAFITLMAVAGLNDYQTKRRAETGYWPCLWRQVNGNDTPHSATELASILEPFYQNERLGSDKVERLHQFLGSPLAHEMWSVQAGQLDEFAEDLPDFWRKLGTAMEQKPRKKTIAFAAKTIASALIILGINSFNYRDIPIPPDSRLADLTPLFKSCSKNGKLTLTSKGQRNIQAFWAAVLKKLQDSEPRILMYHLDTFLWTYVGAKSKLAWLESQGIDNELAEQVIDTFSAIREVRPL